MASLTSRRMPSARPSVPCSVRSCKTVFKSSGLVWWVIGVLSWLCFVTPQHETTMARPRPVFRARRVLTPPGFGCAWLAALAFAPPHPGGVRTEGRKTNYRKHLTPAPYSQDSYQACVWEHGFQGTSSYFSSQPDRYGYSSATASA